MRPHFRISLLLSALFVTLLLGCETVRFKQMALYDRYEAPEKSVQPAQIVFDDAVGTLWNSLETCGAFEVTREAAHSGQSSIKISWDKGKGCEWIGFGNSFSNWTPADMSEQRFEKALSFYVRTQDKTARTIPLVACLEDFGGGGSYHFVDAGKYLHGLEIDTTWKQVIVPLWDFPVREEEVDIYSIKQMKFQLEGAGSYFLDDIRLIDYSKAAYTKMREDVEAMKPKGAPEQVVYREGQFEFDAWGQHNNRCQTLAEKQAPDAGKFIAWEFNPKDCDWAKWGLNWNGWYQVNLRGVTENGHLKFRCKTDGKAAFRILLEDFRYHSTEVFNSAALKAEYSGWQDVDIPLRELGLQQKGFVMDQIRHLQFVGKTAGTVHFDDIKITTTR